MAGSSVMFPAIKVFDGNFEDGTTYLEVSIKKKLFNYSKKESSNTQIIPKISVDTY